MGRWWYVGWLSCAALVCSCDATPLYPQPTVTAQGLLHSLHSLEHLPRLRPARSELASTWDRSGGNFDGNDFPAITGSVNVLLDVEGPGAIHRVSTGLLGEFVEGTRIQIFFDDEPSARLDMEVNEFFDPGAGPFGEQLAHHGHYPTVRMPMPFAEHARVQLVSGALEQDPSAEPNWGLYWQIAFTRYASEQPVRTLAWPPSPEVRDAMQRTRDAWAAAMQTPRPNAPITADLFAAHALVPSTSMRIVDRGCGTLDTLEVQLSPNWPIVWQSTRLVISYEDSSTPAIDLPLSQFMGAGDYGDDPEATYESIVMGGGLGSARMRLPMPYRRAVSISVVNEGEHEVEATLSATRTRCASQPADQGYLHAQVHESRAALEDGLRVGPQQMPAHLVFEQQGQGKLAGIILRVDWPFGDLWWGEGDWQVFTDDDPAWPPSYHGTGTEEFFEGGWTFFERRPLAGVIKGRPGRVTLYSFFTNDAFAYQERLRVQVETLGLLIANEWIQDAHPQWSSTALYYDAMP